MLKAGWRSSTFPILLCSSRRAISSSSIVWSGHSKWSTIKHDKAKNDLQKGKLATKFANLISIAARGKEI